MLLILIFVLFLEALNFGRYFSVFDIYIDLYRCELSKNSDMKIAKLSEVTLRHIDNPLRLLTSSDTDRVISLLFVD